jgi:putative transposase
VEVRKVYRFQMRPTAEQEQILSRFAGARRWVWNWGLARTKAYYAEYGKGIGRIALSAELTALKTQPDTAWLKDADSQLLQQTLIDLYRAYKNFFERRTRYPRFKAKKRDVARFRIPQRVTVFDGAVSVPKVGRVRVRQSQPVAGETKSATFKRDATGKWYVSLNVAIEMPDVALPPVDEEGVVGIDLGLKDFAVLSDGERITAPKFYRRRERKLRRANKAFSRTQKGSIGRVKARKRVALVHRKTSNQRRDFLHKLSTRLVKEHTGLCIEDLSLKGMVRTKLSKSVSDAGMGEFRRMLEYKSVWHRKPLATISRWYPSSKTCPVCGTIHNALTLSERVWTCECCETTHDRDLTAAVNIRREGLKQMVAVGHTETRNAGGHAVRLPHRERAWLNPESHRL